MHKYSILIALQITRLALPLSPCNSHDVLQQHLSDNGRRPSHHTVNGAGNFIGQQRK